MPRHLATLACSLLLITAACDRTPESVAPATPAAPAPSDTAAPPPAAEPVESTDADDGLPGRMPRALSAAQLELLRQQLGERDSRALAHYMEGYQQVRTDAQFAAHYDAGDPLFAAILDLDGEGRPPLDTRVPEGSFDTAFALRTGCAAECSQLDLFYALDDLARLARSTTGDFDDRFIALKRQAEGYSHSPMWAAGTADAATAGDGGETGESGEPTDTDTPEATPPDLAHYRPTPADLNIIKQTWDYGGPCMLGNGASLSFLRDSWQFLHDTELFATDVQHLRSVWIAIMINNGSYELGKDAVLAELRQILAAGVLSAEEEPLLRTLQTQLERGVNEHDVPFEFNCSEQECAVG